MKRILIILVVVTLLLCGCCKKEAEEAEEAEETKQRFVVEYQQSLGLIADIKIIRDTETGKAYLYARNGNSGGLTILEEDE